MTMHADNAPRGAAVLGGVFAPPTRAHVSLLLAAMRAMNAECGVFVPAGHTYLSGARSGSRPGSAYEDTRTRLDMLRAITRADARLRVCDRELFLEAPAYTADTLDALAMEHGRAVFVMGADTLRTLPRWHEAERILRDHGVLVACRDGDAWESVMNASSFLRAHKNELIPFPSPDGTCGVSATRVRDLIARGDTQSAARLLPHGVMEIIQARVLPRLAEVPRDCERT